MTKDEMKNRISLALKDPVLQQGFECICKENAELKETIRKGTFCGDWNDDFHTCQMYIKDEELYNYIHQLNEAKEIIKKFSEFVNNEVEYDPEHPQEHTDLWNKLCERAEEFLKEEENDSNS